MNLTATVFDKQHLKIYTEIIRNKTTIQTSGYFPILQIQTFRALHLDAEAHWDEPQVVH